MSGRVGSRAFVVPQDPGDGWRERGACTLPGVNPEWFYPDKTGSYRQARKVCAGCPVLEQCRAWALATREPHGMWGGLSEHQRQTILRMQRRVG